MDYLRIGMVSCINLNGRLNTLLVQELGKPRNNICTICRKSMHFFTYEIYLFQAAKRDLTCGNRMLSSFLKTRFKTLQLSAKSTVH